MLSIHWSVTISESRTRKQYIPYIIYQGCFEVKDIFNCYTLLKCLIQIIIFYRKIIFRQNVRHYPVSFQNAMILTELLNQFTLWKWPQLITIISHRDVDIHLALNSKHFSQSAPHLLQSILIYPIKGMQSNFCRAWPNQTLHH